MRSAIYYAPAPGSDLHRIGSTWLGRDAFSGEATRAADPARDPIVADPARYGVHATLRSPFRLREGTNLDAVAQRLAEFGGNRTAPVIRRVALARLGRFFALVPADPEPAIAALEADVLAAFEPFRAPLTTAEAARRQSERLSERQRVLLERWGYPFVLDEFRFHITLTGPVETEAADRRRELDDHFAPVLGRPLRLDGLGLFVEPEPGAPFRVHAFRPFAAAAAEPSVIR